MGRCPVRCRVGILRAGHWNDVADRVAGGSGVRRRLPHGDRYGGDRRRHSVARAGEVPRWPRGCVRCHDGPRTAARRPLHRPPVVAVDLLHQPARRHRRDRPCGVHDAIHQVVRPTRYRLPGHRLRVPWCGRAYPCAVLGRDRVCVGILDDHLDDRWVAGVAGDLRVRGAPGGRPGSAAAVIPFLGLQRVRRARLHRGLRDARVDDVPAHLPAVREGLIGDRVGPANPPNGRWACW